MLNVFSDIIDAMDNGHLALLSLLDLSAAFDTVNHFVLSERLERSFGVKGASLRWFESYLAGRSQSVYIAGESPTLRILVCVPQGSVLGPFLFTLYTGDIGHIIRVHGLLHHCYADDIKLYFFCKPSEAAVLKARVIRRISDIADWMSSNRLKLNPAKSELL